MSLKVLYRLVTKARIDLLCKYLLRTKPTIVLFHGIASDDCDLDCWWLLRESKFRRQIEFLGRAHRFISLQDALSRENVTENSCVLTFDDGYRSVLTHAYPFLKENGIPFTVYVTTGPVERKTLIWTDEIFLFLQDKQEAEIASTFSSMNLKGRYPNKRALQMEALNSLKGLPHKVRCGFVQEMLQGSGASRGYASSAKNPFEMLSIEDIRLLSRDPLVTIGAHTVNHEVLTRMSLAEAVEEILKSRSSLEEWIGRPVTDFSYPNGEYNPALVDKVRELGFRSAVRIGLGINWSINPFEIERVGTDPQDDDIVFQVMTNGIIPLKVDLLRLLGLKPR